MKEKILLKDKLLLNVYEVMEVTGWGENAVRNELNHPSCKFVVRRGNRLFANKKALEKYIDSITGNKL